MNTCAKCRYWRPTLEGGKVHPCIRVWRTISYKYTKRTDTCELFEAKSAKDDA